MTHLRLFVCDCLSVAALRTSCQRRRSRNILDDVTLTHRQPVRSGALVIGVHDCDRAGGMVQDALAHRAEERSHVGTPAVGADDK